jgi:predicted nucleic acid-binding protein
MPYLFDTDAISELLRPRPLRAYVNLQIAATAIYHDLELVSGNLRHFSRIPELKLNPVLANARSDQR